MAVQCWCRAERFSRPVGRNSCFWRQPGPSGAANGQQPATGPLSSRLWLELAAVSQAGRHYRLQPWIDPACPTPARCAEGKEKERGRSRADFRQRGCRWIWGCDGVCSAPKFPATYLCASRVAGCFYKIPLVEICHFALVCIIHQLSHAGAGSAIVCGRGHKEGGLIKGSFRLDHFKAALTGWAVDGGGRQRSQRGNVSG